MKILFCLIRQDKSFFLFSIFILFWINFCFYFFEVMFLLMHNTLFKLIYIVINLMAISICICGCYYYYYFLFVRYINKKTTDKTVSLINFVFVYQLHLSKFIFSVEKYKKKRAWFIYWRSLLAIKNITHIIFFSNWFVSFPFCFIFCRVHIVF